ncbi:MAG TPA: protein kinase, partial [Chloroflexota bacterium]|nr:protein kinase [Chloroflexota bacterium]
MEEIGRGAYSVVYRARRGDLPVAVKLQRARAEAAPAGWSGPLDPRARLRREAAILGRVRHPALPSVWEVGEVDGRVYLVMELVEGPSLASLLIEGPLPQPDIIALGRTLAAALAELHRAGLVHRDVKPQNVVLPAAAPGAAKLVDFGFASHADTRSAEDEVTGTLLYCAPEQAGMLRRPVDARSDLYALGAVLFECATGRPPFQSQEAGELLHAHATLPPPGARDLNPAVSPALAAILARLLAKDPDDRYQTGGGLLRDLNRIEQLDALLRAGDDAVVLGGTDRAPRQSEDAPLIGRDADLAHLSEGWAQALGARGSTALVVGAPGSGKSRLVWEHLQGVRRDGGAVFHGKCIEENPFPLAVLREAVDGWRRQVRQRPRHARAAAEDALRRAAGERAPLLRALSPLLAQTLAQPTGAQPADPAALDADRFHEAAADFLVKLLASEARGERGGGVLFLDDV